MSRPSIRFGTDGWRALVAEEFTFPNVRWVTQAVSGYLKSHPASGRGRKVIVGYDTRPLGDRFAEAVAEVFAGNGFQVLLTNGPMPTPAISFAIRELGLQGGIGVTASDNPFTYNGLKFKPSYAGPAQPQMTHWIERRLFKGKLRRIPLQEGIAQGKIRLIDLAPLYLGFLKRYVRWNAIRKADFRIAYDSMQGAGQDFLERLTAGSRLRVISVDAGDSRGRSSHRPEPVGEHLGRLKAVVRKQRCDLGLATDGDADRAGIVAPGGDFISSQETMSLLLWHLLEDRRWRGMVVTTVAGTNLMEAIARCYQVPFKRTPVGFKHIARLMRTTDVLFGGEESGGFGFRGCVPERDGLLAGLLILEMMAMRKKSLGTILHQMKTRFGQWVYARTDLTLTKPIKKVPGTKAAQLYKSFARMVPGTIQKIQTTDGLKVIFADKNWLLLRPSGTEPLLRIYAEGRTSKQVKNLLKAGQQMGRQIAAQ